MKFVLTFLALICLANQAIAQRVYAPEVTGDGDLKYDNETLVYILRPEKIEDIQLSENQIHIQLKDGPREYFYTLTSLNKGKNLIIKTAGGETVQEGIIRSNIDSGLIISKPIKGRNNLIKMVKHIKAGKKPIIIEKREITPVERTINDIRANQTDPNEKAYFESREEMKNMRQELNN
tara:strand:- start:209804 stop:210337 length:534 start_codon:yes stop_codon:yes gene_type:complete